MVDALFADPRLAAVQDALDPDRSDLEVYAALVEEIGARSVLDVGCGTGTLACLLSRRGVAVVGVDPAAASLDVARGKPGAAKVRWVHGDATSLPPLQVDAATMTGNVAQVFLTDAAWAATLVGIRAALRPGGRLILETRDPAARAWERWTPESTRRRATLPGGGAVESWIEVVDVSEPLVSFRTTFAFSGGPTLTAGSTLRFRGLAELESSLRAAGLEVDEVRDAPDRPGLELVVVARRG